MGGLMEISDVGQYSTVKKETNRGYSDKHEAVGVLQHKERKWRAKNEGRAGAALGRNN